jgi:phage baseplate assembly protein W
MGSIVEDELRKEAIDVIDKHEPRAKVLKLDIKPDYDRGAYYLFLTLMILGKQDPINFTVTLTRVR